MGTIEVAQTNREISLCQYGLTLKEAHRVLEIFNDVYSEKPLEERLGLALFEIFPIAWKHDDDAIKWVTVELRQYGRIETCNIKLLENILSKVQELFKKEKGIPGYIAYSSDGKKYWGGNGSNKNSPALSHMAAELVLKAGVGYTHAVEQTAFLNRYVEIVKVGEMYEQNLPDVLIFDNETGKVSNY